MSRLLPERLQLAVSTAGVRASVLDWRGRPVRQVDRQMVSPLGPDPKDWPVDLGDLLRQCRSRARSLNIVLSTAWARFALVPWSLHAITLAEQSALASAVIADTYGEQPGGWQIALAGGGYNRPALACALPARLVTGLDVMARREDLRLRSLRPAFSGLPAGASRSSRSTLLAGYQEGKLDLSLVRQGRIYSYRSYRTAEPASSIVQACRSWGVDGEGPIALRYWGDVPCERVLLTGQGIDLVQMQLLDGFVREGEA